MNNKVKRLLLSTSLLATALSVSQSFADSPVVHEQTRALNELNSIRTKMGLWPVETRAQLKRSAYLQSFNKVKNALLHQQAGEAHNQNLFSSFFLGENVKERAEASGYNLDITTVGEVMTTAHSYTEAMSDLIHTVYHRFGLLNPDFFHIGMSYTPIKKGGTSLYVMNLGGIPSGSISAFTGWGKTEMAPLKPHTCFQSTDSCTSVKAPWISQMESQLGIAALSRAADHNVMKFNQFDSEHRSAVTRLSHDLHETGVNIPAPSEEQKLQDTCTEDSQDEQCAQFNELWDTMLNLEQNQRDLHYTHQAKDLHIKPFTELWQNSIRAVPVLTAFPFSSNDLPESYRRVPVSFYTLSESPSPLPKSMGVSGYPITMEFSPFVQEPIITSVTLKNGSKKTLPVIQLDSELDLENKLNDHQYAFLPLTPLEWNSQYVMEISYRVTINDEVVQRSDTLKFQTMEKPVNAIEINSDFASQEIMTTEGTGKASFTVAPSYGELISSSRSSNDECYTSKFQGDKLEVIVEGACTLTLKIQKDFSANKQQCHTRNQAAATCLANNYRSKTACSREIEEYRHCAENATAPSSTTSIVQITTVSGDF